MPVRPDPTASARSPWPRQALHGSQGLYTGTIDKLGVSTKVRLMSESLPPFCILYGALSLPFDVSDYKNVQENYDEA